MKRHQQSASKAAKQTQKSSKQQAKKTQKRSISISTPKRKVAKKAPAALNFPLRAFSTVEAAPAPPAQAPDAVDFGEEPEARSFQKRTPFNNDDEEGGKPYNFTVKQDNPSSFHGPVYTAAPLKVNISNIFDARADYKMDSGYYTMRFEIDHYGKNIEEDLIEKSDWHDKHITNEWFDTMITRHCPHLSKKAKQMKPSNERQGRARKLHKESNEKRLAKSIRDAIDNTPRFSVFSNSLAENKQIYGTYLPSEEAFREYKTSGRELAAKLAIRGKETDYKQALLRRLREERGEVDV